MRVSCGSGFSFAMVALALAVGCGGQPVPVAEPVPVEKAEPTTPLPTLLMVQSIFETGPDKKPVPQPARLTLWRTDGSTWWSSHIDDADSNVFHKAKAWRGGILTIGAEGAKVKHWTRDGGEWTARVLWERTWGGKFNRMRDIELADLDGDGREEMVVATHDVGVIAVGVETDGSWAFTELGETPDTFVHEIEIGDVDGDGVVEFYATPSGRNQASGASQAGGVVRFDLQNGQWVRSDVVQWADTHAKEILVADVDGDGVDELYAAREGKADKASGRLLEPVQIVRLARGDQGWVETVVATLPAEPQCRFLVPGDVDGDGQIEIVAAGKTSGLWVLEPGPQGTFEPTLIDASSGGFEHATHLADLDGDGTPEIYVAAEKPRKPRELRRYTYNGSGYSREVIATLDGMGLVWNLQHGSF